MNEPEFWTCWECWNFRHRSCVGATWEGNRAVECACKLAGHHKEEN